MDNNQLTDKAYAAARDASDGSNGFIDAYAEGYEVAYKQALQDVQAQIAALTKQEAGGESAKRRIASYNYALNQVLSPFQELL